MPDPSVLLTGAGGMVGAMRGFAGGTVAALVACAILIFEAGNRPVESVPRLRH